MNKPKIIKPTIFVMYGFPGSGKSYFGRQFADDSSSAYINEDVLRFEFIEKPTYDKEENSTVEHLSTYMLNNFLKAGVSVIYDCSNDRVAERKLLHSIANQYKAEVVIVWLQIDTESSFDRVNNRDGRRIDDKYAEELDRTTFENRISKMQNPTEKEDFVVISGKHTFNAQKHAVYKKLLEKKLLDPDYASSNLPKPGMINLVPNLYGGRVDDKRRNINVY
jgi:predicted kinase